MSKQWVYFDASALAKRYAQENGTPVVNELFRHLSVSRMTCFELGVLEIVSIFVRKRNDGRLDQRLFQQAIVEFKTEVIENSDFPLTRANDVLDGIALILEHNINATDAAILRSALDLQQTLIQAESQLMFWTSDKRLARAAQKEGLTVFDPEVESVSTLRQLLNIQDSST